MLRCAKDLGLRAKSLKTKWSRLESTPVPNIVRLRSGEFVVLGKVSADKVIVQRPFDTRPVMISREEFEADWSGELILMTRRAGLVDLTRRFDITWFLGAIYKYRSLLREVLVASFFIQLFSLVSPLLFQVVIDKVLVHRSLGTLDILIIGLVAIVGVRSHPERTAHVSFRAHHKSNRRRTRRAPIPASARAAALVLSGETCWRIRSPASANSKTSAIF